MITHANDKAVFGDGYTAGFMACLHEVPRGDARDFLDVDDPWTAGWLCGWDEGDMVVRLCVATQQGADAATTPASCPYQGDLHERERDAWIQGWRLEAEYAAAHGAGA